MAGTQPNAPPDMLDPDLLYFRYVRGELKTVYWCNRIATNNCLVPEGGTTFVRNFPCRYCRLFGEFTKDSPRPPEVWPPIY